MLDVGDAAIDVADDGRAVERRPDERVHLAGRVDVAHPVVAVGVDAEAGEDVDEDPRVVPGVGRVAVGDLVGDVRERAAHLGRDRIGRQERLRIHRVEVVDAVEERRLDPVRAERADDGVEDDRPTKAADVDGPGRGLRVVDDLRAPVADLRREFVRPVHGGPPRLS